MKILDTKTHLILRIEKNEDIVECIVKAVAEYNVKLGVVTGLGALDKLEVGYFETESKKYFSEVMEGGYELTSLVGNVTTLKGEPYVHLHATVSDEESKVFGGHLNYARVAATGEIFIEKIDGEVDRFFSDEIGLNLMEI